MGLQFWKLWMKSFKQVVTQLNKPEVIWIFFLENNKSPILGQPVWLKLNFNFNFDLELCRMWEGGLCHQW